MGLKHGVIDRLGDWLFNANDAATAPDTNVTISGGGSSRELLCELSCDAMAHFMAQDRKFNMTGRSTEMMLRSVMSKLAKDTSGVAEVRLFP